MPFPQPATLQRIESLTDAIEAESAAEVVVTVASRSGAYRDVDLTWGSLLAFLTLLILVFSPIEVSEAGLVPNLLIAYALGVHASRRSSRMRRLLTSPDRRRQQVRDAAQRAFLAEALDAVPGRVGVLLYVSMLEREVELVVDHGVAAALGPAPVQEFRLRLSRCGEGALLDDFLEAFEALGLALRKGLPVTADTVHLVPNRPRLVEG